MGVRNWVVGDYVRGRKKTLSNSSTGDLFEIGDESTIFSTGLPSPKPRAHTNGFPPASRPASYFIEPVAPTPRSSKISKPV